VRYTICSSRPAEGHGWRMGGTITPASEADGEALVEHCHVVSSRTRLTESGRLSPSPAGAGQTAPGERAAPRLAAHG
jgi:hypothetical protein